MFLETLQFVFPYFITLLVVCNPFAVIALFLSMTSSYTAKERLKISKTCCLVAFGILEFFALTGKKIFEFFGISIGSFYIAGGILIFLVGLDMLRGQDPSDDIIEDKSKESKGAAGKKKDIAITPLGIPLIAGPCCIANTIAQQTRASNYFEWGGGLIAVALVMGMMYLFLAMSSRGTKWLTPTVLKLGYRLSGLILAALAVEMIISGLRTKEIGLMPEQREIARIITSGSNLGEHGIPLNISPRKIAERTRCPCQVFWDRLSRVHCT
jgi:multiple antibiotic resistance protein